jgi:tRNA U34 5-methylaminomethyl-2-thiouridine-forming methyltransferase MnmC
MDQVRLQSTADGCDTLYSYRYNQTFHSTFGALAEAEHVFLKGTGLVDRLAAGQPARVLEVGFGTGLNFFLTAQMARSIGAPLHYVSLERDLLSASVLDRLNHETILPAASAMQAAFRQWRRDLPDVVGEGRYKWFFEQTLCLELIIGEATTVDIPELSYQAIYQDAFSPEANRELWTESFSPVSIPYWKWADDWRLIQSKVRCGGSCRPWASRCKSSRDRRVSGRYWWR